MFSAGSGTESDSDESVPELEEQDSTQATTQQAQVGQVALAIPGWLRVARIVTDPCGFSLPAARSSSRNR